MSLNTRTYPILYSAGTYLAYKIAVQYYGNVHYVWCTTEFNSSKQPPISIPATICKRFLEQIISGDRHAFEINSNITGILRGADAKYRAGVISEKELQEIKEIVSTASYKDFFPVIYIIHSGRVKSRCLEVPLDDRASDSSVEYKVEDLKNGEFQIMSFVDVLSGAVQASDRKVGC